MSSESQVASPSTTEGNISLWEYQAYVLCAAGLVESWYTCSGICTTFLRVTLTKVFRYAQAAVCGTGKENAFRVIEH